MNPEQELDFRRTLEAETVADWLHALAERIRNKQVVGITLEWGAGDETIRFTYMPANPLDAATDLLTNHNPLDVV